MKKCNPGRSRSMEDKQIRDANAQTKQRGEIMARYLAFSLYLCLGDTPLFRPFIRISNGCESAVQHRAGDQASGIIYYPLGQKSYLHSLHDPFDANTERE